MWLRRVHTQETTNKITSVSRNRNNDNKRNNNTNTKRNSTNFHNKSGSISVIAKGLILIVN